MGQVCVGPCIIVLWEEHLVQISQSIFFSCCNNASILSAVMVTSRESIRSTPRNSDAMRLLYITIYAWEETFSLSVNSVLELNHSITIWSHKSSILRDHYQTRIVMIKRVHEQTTVYWWPLVEFSICNIKPWGYHMPEFCIFSMECKCFSMVALLGLKWWGSSWTKAIWSTSSRYLSLFS